MKQKHVIMLAVIFMITLTAACLMSIHSEGKGASSPIPRQISFTGEYKQEDGEWTKLTDPEQLSTLEGNLTLRGSFSEDIPSGTVLNFYQNHIAISIYANDQLIYMNAEADLGLQPFLCERIWEKMPSPGILASDAVEIHLENNHKFGNKGAYGDFLKTLCLTPQDDSILISSLSPYSSAFASAGTMLMAIALVLFGVCCAAPLLRLPATGTLWTLFVMCASASAYFIFDTMEFALQSEHAAWSTYGRSISAIYFTLSVFLLAAIRNSGKTQTISKFIFSTSLVSAIAVLAAVSSGIALIYDAMCYWAMLHFLLFIACALCNAEETLRGRRENIIYSSTCMTLSITMLLDLNGVLGTIATSATCTKAAFVVLAVFQLVKALIDIAEARHQATRTETLEQELEKNKISLMLSQMSPHFLYNVLNTIYYLCDKDPKQAQYAVGSFADYLRGNMSSLETENVVPFEDELQHIKTYLSLEKLRFDDELNVEYQIQTSNFHLPALTVQAIVENAVKHGTSKKRGGGTVTIATEESEDRIKITVSDDGVGFDINAEPADTTRSHLGIRNVRKRLESAVNGSLNIESKPGEGTIATITIPKQKEQKDADHSRRR